MIEMAPQEDGRFVMGFAGDTFNTAWYARRVAGPDLDVAYLTAIGDDGPSQAMLTFIADAGITPEVQVRPGQTVGLYLITLDGAERSFSYWRSTSAARTLADELETLPDIGARDLVYFSGITLAILPAAGRRRLLQTIGRARKSGATIAFDPNLRPRLWFSIDDMRDWITQGAALADIALPSFDDEATHFGDADPMATADRYAKSGARLIAVKDGGGPILIRADGVTHSIQPEAPPRIVDTTAAGDSFNAQFLVGCLGGAKPDAAARTASALAGRVIGERGALVSV